MTAVRAPSGLPLRAGAVEPDRIPLLAGAQTPLVHAARLSSVLGAEIWFKRDDLTGFGLGGNKVRGLEYLLGEAVALGADTVVTGAGTQSNWAMLAALGATTCGLQAELVYYGTPRPIEGNLALVRLTGARVRFTGDPERASVDAGIEQVTAELREAGRRPYPLPRGGATPLGALGYVRGCVELATQVHEHGIDPAELWLSTGSCGTQAGLVAGLRAVGLRARIHGVTVSRPAGECRARVASLAAAASERGGLIVDPAPSEVVDGFLGPGYGLVSAEGRAAAALVARTEGVFLDPVFGAKAMAGLCARLREGPPPDGPVVFLVTGGAPTLFAIADPDRPDDKDVPTWP